MINTLRAVILGALCVASGAVLAQSANSPTLKDGDKWIYNATEEKNSAGAMGSSTRKWEISISRAGSRTISVATKPVDSNMPPKELSRDADWSVVQNIGGKNTMTSHPFDFPMQPGKTWKVEYVIERPDAQTKTEKISKQYTVIGWEEIKVAAGTFHALKVEMEGEWSKEFNTRGPSATSGVSTGEAGSVAVAQSLNAATPKPVSGRLYQAFWYVPEVKSHVKLIVEDYQAGGSLNKRMTENLESFSVDSH